MKPAEMTRLLLLFFLWIPFCSEVLHGLGKDVGTYVVIPPLSISMDIGPTDQMSRLSSKLRALVSMPRWMKNSSANNNISGDGNIRKLTADELFMRNLIKHLHSSAAGKRRCTCLIWFHKPGTGECENVFCCWDHRGPEFLGRRPQEPERPWTHHWLWLPTQSNSFTSWLKS